jgi:hypothetical protein
MPSRNWGVKSWQEIQACESDANDLKRILAIRTMIWSASAAPLTIRHFSPRVKWQIKIKIAFKVYKLIRHLIAKL